jgi:type IV pilus assembly protein PilB
MSGLARALVQAGRLTVAQADALQKSASAEKTQFIDALLASKSIDGAALASFCAETFGYPVLDLSAYSVESIPPGAATACRWPCRTRPTPRRSTRSSSRARRRWSR